MKINYYISTKRWTGLVATNEYGIIVETCPIAKWWINSSIKGLLGALIDQKQFLKMEVIDE